jgi:hypothetical protein
MLEHIPLVYGYDSAGYNGADNENAGDENNKPEPDALSQFFTKHIAAYCPVVITLYRSYLITFVTDFMKAGGT